MSYKRIKFSKSINRLKYEAQNKRALNELAKFKYCRNVKQIKEKEKL